MNQMTRRHISIIAVLALAATLGWYLFQDLNPETTTEAPVDGSEAPIVTVTVPESLSMRAQLGQRTFEENCVSCHGLNAAGKEGIAPPLIHLYYEPGHHGDEAFQRAVAVGVKAHHWRFGDMPPVEGLTRRDVDPIIAYIRELQKANGIF